MTDSRSIDELEKAARKALARYDPAELDGYILALAEKARAAVEQAVLAEHERCVKFMCEYVRRVYKFDPAGLAYAIRNESKPPTEPPRCGTCGSDTPSIFRPPCRFDGASNMFHWYGTCGTCGGSGLSGELSYGGFAKPCPDCQKETSCGTCGSDDPRFMVSSNGVALRECPDPFHGTKKETP